MTGRSAASRAATKRIKVRRAPIRWQSSRFEIQDDAGVAERLREFGRRRRKLGALDGELQRLVEEGVPRLLLELVLEDLPPASDPGDHAGREEEALALGDHRRHEVLLEH